MPIDPTRKEWKIARERVWKAARELSESQVQRLTEAALGLYPPEPAPREWRSGGLLLTGYYNDVWVGFQRVAHERLTPDEADAMACSLVEHAAYAREQEASDEPACGRVLVGQGSDTWDPLCVRPKGHPGVCCHDGWTHGDHAREQEAPKGEPPVTDARTAAGYMARRFNLSVTSADGDAPDHRRYHYPSRRDLPARSRAGTAPTTAPQPL